MHGVFEAGIGPGRDKEVEFPQSLHQVENLVHRAAQSRGNLLRRTVRLAQQGVVDRKGGFIHTQRFQHVFCTLSNARLEQTIYRLRRFGALSMSVRIFSKGPAVIKRCLTVTALGVLVVVTTVLPGA
jgi:hypothetical protein